MDKTWMDKIVIDNLSERQKEVFLLYKKVGMTQKMVAEELGCTRQNISRILNSIKNKEPKTEGRKKNNKPEKQKRKTVSKNYQQYKSADLSILTDREKEILTMKMEGKTYKEIAERLETSTSCVGSMLNRAKNKLEGKETCQQKYQQKNRELINARRRTPEHREKERKRHRNFMNNHPEFKDHLKAYRRRYYLENRERIIEKVKKRREEKREMMNNLQKKRTITGVMA